MVVHLNPNGTKNPKIFLSLRRIYSWNDTSTKNEWLYSLNVMTSWHCWPSERGIKRRILTLHMPLPPPWWCHIHPYPHPQSTHTHLHSVHIASISIETGSCNFIGSRCPCSCGYRHPIRNTWATLCMELGDYWTPYGVPRAEVCVCLVHTRVFKMQKHVYIASDTLQRIWWYVYTQLWSWKMSWYNMVYGLWNKLKKLQDMVTGHCTSYVQSVLMSWYHYERSDVKPLTNMA